MATEQVDEVEKVVSVYNQLKNVKGVSDRLTMDAKKVRRYLRSKGIYVSKLKSTNQEKHKVVQKAEAPKIDDKNDLNKFASEITTTPAPTIKAKVSPKK